MYYTYAHYTADTKELFYIGKGTSVKDYAHKRAACYWKRNPYWKNKVAKHGGFTYEILAYWKTEKEAFEHERFLISVLKDKLVNLTEGGEGAGGRKQTEAEKIKRANAIRGSRRTPESLKRMSEAQQKNKVAVETLLNEIEKQKKRVLCVTTGVVYPSLMEASKATSVVFQNISKCCLGSRKSAGGLKWEYLND